MIWLAYCVMWISFAAVTITGILITKSTWCIWIMLIPALVRYCSKNDKDCNKLKTKETGDDKHE